MRTKSCWTSREQVGQTGVGQAAEGGVAVGRVAIEKLDGERECIAASWKRVAGYTILTQQSSEEIIR